MVVGCWCLVVGVWLLVFGCWCLVVCLEDSTEQSESNPGRSLGIITKEKRAVWKTVPHCCAPSPSAQSARAQKVHG